MNQKGLLAEATKDARHKVILYQNHNEKRLNYPDLFISASPIIESPLYWDTDPVKLKELLTTIDLDKAISDVSRDTAPFSTIVECFEQFLHVKLGKATEVKRTITDRKFSTTSYLEALTTKLGQSKG